MDNPLRQQLLTTQEASAILRISRSQLYLLLQRGELRSVAIGRRRLITRAALEEFVARLEAQQVEQSR
jgi:excisionase family DNA binding protein